MPFYIGCRRNSRNRHMNWNEVGDSQCTVTIVLIIASEYTNAACL